MENKVHIISLSDIDSSDHRYRITTREDIESLGDAIRTVGLISPPFLRGNGDRYSIVSGFRRVAACRALGWTAVPAQVAGGPAGDLEYASVAIADNATQRPLNLIEASRAVQLLISLFPDMVHLSEFSSKLGLPGSPALFGKLERLCHMAPQLQRGILSESISLAIALELDGCEPAVGISFTKLFTSLKLSLNKQREVVTLIKEIALREDLPMIELLEAGDLRAILNDRDLDRTQKVGQLRTLLRKRRFPNLASAEKRFKESVRGMKIGEGIQLIPPRNFESSDYTLQMRFRDADELKRHRSTLDEIIEHPSLKTILDR
jgi:ParB family chromosome partitioning protein